MNNITSINKPSGSPSDLAHLCSLASICCLTQYSFVHSHKHYVFPWVEDSRDGEVVAKLYCRDCRAAGLKNDFALGKTRPAKGWKK